jgi:hypothetical protein
LAEIRKQTAEVSAILAKVFARDVVAPAPTEPIAATETSLAGLDPDCSELVDWLEANSPINRAEFENV